MGPQPSQMGKRNWWSQQAFCLLPWGLIWSMAVRHRRTYTRVHTRTYTHTVVNHSTRPPPCSRHCKVKDVFGLSENKNPKAFMATLSLPLIAPSKTRQRRYVFLIRLRANWSVKCNHLPRAGRRIRDRKQKQTFSVLWPPPLCTFPTAWRRFYNIVWWFVKSSLLLYGTIRSLGCRVTSGSVLCSPHNMVPSRVTPRVCLGLG